ncbi:Acyl-CoA synthetase family member 4 [Armadillidium vulgare]|nr:Acyl-CoA synthetase family member 4 [Armadillidium vulgare]
MDEKVAVKLHDHFYNKSHLLENKIAITFYSDEERELSITYKELYQRSLTTSAIISKHLKLFPNTYFNTVVGLYCDAGIPAVVFILSILRVGGFFYLSPDLTKHELNGLFERVIVKYIVIQNTYQNRIPEKFKSKILTNIEILNVHFSLICLTVSESSVQLNLEVMAKDSLAYVISTSGTTGFPKIVYVNHKCITQNIEDFKSIFNIMVDDTILNLSPLHFDPSIVDIFLALSYGARLIILSSHILKKPLTLEKVMNSNPISFMQTTPTLFRTLNPKFIQSLLRNENLKTLAFGGENFPSQAEFRVWFNLSSKVKIYNLYGLTEMSCWAMYHNVDMNQVLSANLEENIGSYCPIPLGKPLTDVEILLIDKFGNRISKGEGQIFLSGKRNRCFIDDPDYPDQGIGNDIKTGDIGYSDGVNLFYVERSDNIIKRNACKISLLEIEIVSQYLKEVRESCGVYLDNKIILFVSSPLNNLSEEKDLLKLAYNNSKESDFEILQENGKFIKPYSYSSIKKKGLFKVYHNGGHSVVSKNFKLFNENLFVKWTVCLDKCIDSSPLILESKNQIRIFIGSHSHKFICIDNFGKICWEINLPDRIESSAVVSSSGDSVYIGCYDGILYCIDIYSGKYFWTLKTEGVIKATCIVDSASDSVIFGSYDKHLYCCSEKGVLKWKTKLSNGYIKSSSALETSGCIYCIEVHFIDGNCKPYSIRTIQLNDSVFSSPVFYKENIYIGCRDNMLYCLNT